MARIPDAHELDGDVLTVRLFETSTQLKPRGIGTFIHFICKWHLGLIVPRQ